MRKEHSNLKENLQLEETEYNYPQLTYPMSLGSDLEWPDHIGL